MFGGSFDLAIRSAPLALHRAKHQAKQFWWSGYAVAGICGLRMILFAGLLRSARLPPVPVGRFVLASPDYRAVLHRGIGIAQPRKRRLDIRLPPRFPGPAGIDDGRSFA